MKFDSDEMADVLVDVVCGEVVAFSDLSIEEANDKVREAIGTARALHDKEPGHARVRRDFWSDVVRCLERRLAPRVVVRS